MRTSPFARLPPENVVLRGGGSTLLPMDAYRSPSTFVDTNFSVLDLLLFVPVRATSRENKALGAGRRCTGRCLCRFSPCLRAGDPLTAYQVISFAQWAMVYAALDRGAGRSVSSPQTSSLGTPAKVRMCS